jgi:biopolymer transport protein ExbD/biopolymer transport protein TolR
MSILFLLMFYVASTTNPHFSRTVDLSRATFSHLEPGALREDAINVTVTRDGKVFLRNREASLEELPVLIQSAIKEGSERKVYLRADTKARNSDVEAAIARIRAGGISAVAIICQNPA